jgi:hypothetical protein
MAYTPTLADGHTLMDTLAHTGDRAELIAVAGGVLLNAIGFFWLLQPCHSEM